MIIDCISDLHGFYPKLEGGDLLIVAGDLTKRDKPIEHEEFYLWLAEQDYDKKIVIAGNHDNFLVDHPDQFRLNEDGIEYLCDSGTEFEGLRIWGSPWTKTFEGMNPHCKAFTCDTEEELAEKWAMIPDDIDILITHSPPYGIFDSVRRFPQDIPENTGSKYLSDKFRGSTTLKLHIFGHIHEHGGKSGDIGMTKFINCSHVNERYQPVNKPVRIVL